MSVTIIPTSIVVEARNAAVMTPAAAPSIIRIVVVLPRDPAPSI
jgi:hypothetical protein